ncbi:hypothetical protein ANN_18011 [Periplaneta americana]|uniref:DUF4817 domain-containing protein n=1 Tax=Periplaneta americana TaxID=6978 RepID=A0ABQ8SNT8_PERAM|nr:hypothetical protein ANN_18011 [Periplaneta americana]
MLVTADVISVSPVCRNFLSHASKSTNMSLSHLCTLKCHRVGTESYPLPQCIDFDERITLKDCRRYDFVYLRINSQTSGKGSRFDTLHKVAYILRNISCLRSNFTNIIPKLITEWKYAKYIDFKLFSTFCVNVKMQYTLNQRLLLVKQYWITNSITATQRAYQREFGVRNPPKRNTILGLVNKLETTGSLMKHGSIYPVDDRIISRNLWPPRSPDLTTPDNICYRGISSLVRKGESQTVRGLDCRVGDCRLNNASDTWVVLQRSLVDRNGLRRWTSYGRDNQAPYTSNISFFGRRKKMGKKRKGLHLAVLNKCTVTIVETHHFYSVVTARSACVTSDRIIAVCSTRLKLAAKFDCRLTIK